MESLFRIASIPACVFILSFVTETTNFWTVAGNTFNIGLATIKQGSTKLSGQRKIQLSPAYNKENTSNISITQIEIETSSALKTYAFLSSLDPHEYDLFLVEWRTSESTAVTVLYTNLDGAVCSINKQQVTNQTQRLTAELSCQLFCLQDPSIEVPNETCVLASPQLLFPYQKAHVFSYVPDMVTNILTILNLASWQEMILVYDDFYDPIAQLVISRLKHTMLTVLKVDAKHKQKEAGTKTCADQSQFVEDIDQADYREDVTDLFLKDTYFHLSEGNDMQVLLLCSPEFVKFILSKANRFDSLYNKTTAMHMRSQWMVLATGTDNVHDLEIYLKSLEHLDNVALLCSPSETKFSAFKEDMAWVSNIYLLMSTPKAQL
ncbi:hypothetical protein EGW08_014680 [Elysia chlorotica]|uniref:Uncharacterized protein n=1 Tax=Elysia chlorotica TaxID=188477 RepID=A0A433T7H8_ELYCH|nr:hypothetical protein EGW08_014680 [Elysia chlorotica]